MKNRHWIATIMALLVAGGCSRPQAAARTATQGGASSSAPAESTATPPAGLASAAPTSAASSSATPVRAKPLYVDVRTPKEFSAGHLDGAINIPLGELGQRWTELKAYAGRPIVLYCRTGHRAGIALDSLRQHGFAEVSNGGGLKELEARLRSQK